MEPRPNLGMGLERNSDRNGTPVEAVIRGVYKCNRYSGARVLKFEHARKL